MTLSLEEARLTKQDNTTHAKIVAICISEKRGTKKCRITKGILEKNTGLSGDAHAGKNSLRQVSILAEESIKKMEEKGLTTVPGIFAENIVTSGIDLLSLRLGTRVSVGKTAILEITQIGKKCHTGCEIYKQIGDCIMPREGIFARVIKGGMVQEGDTIMPLEGTKQSKSNQ